MLVAKQDTILFEKSCGVASRSFNVKNNLSTKFNLASVGKIFTSIAIAQLVQQKILTLNMPIYKIIPDWLPNDKASKEITVQQLLTHTSGLTNYMDDPRWKLGADSALYVNLEDLIENVYGKIIILKRYLWGIHQEALTQQHMAYLYCQNRFTTINYLIQNTSNRFFLLPALYLICQAL